MTNLIEEFIQPGLFNGLCYGIAAIGISLPLRFLGTADFTAVGAIMLGGIVTIWVTNMSEWWVFGLLCGSVVASLLGIFTAFLSLNKWFKIPLMLAGIITFTASQSFGLFIAVDASIELSPKIGFLSSIFSWFDIAITVVIALTISLGGGILARSKLGCLAFAMCANSNFVKFRHRNSQETTYWLLAISNFLVGLCGGLIVLKTRTAYSDINMEFLSLTLGAIYTGHAVVQLIAHVLKKKMTVEISSSLQPDNIENHKHYWESFRLSLSPQRDDSGRIWFIFLSYIIASIALNDLAVAVRGDSLFHVSPAWEHIIVAMMITLGLFLSNASQKNK